MRVGSVNSAAFRLSLHKVAAAVSYASLLHTMLAFALLRLVQTLGDTFQKMAFSLNTEVARLCSG